MIELLDLFNRGAHSGPMTEAWDDLPEDCRLWLAEGAMRQACVILATKAEGLAHDMECGEIANRGGPDALRLLARLVRVANMQYEPAAGRA